MRNATLSLMGLFNWDKTLFDLFQLPAGLDKETVINNLLAETAELEILYPNPTVLRNLIGVWSRKNLDVWTKLLETTTYEYNPIENYNRYEEGTSTGTDTGRTAYSGTDTSTATAKDEHYTAGYDPGTPTATDDGLFKQTRDEGESENATTYGRTENRTDSKNDRYTNHMHGNIGVMSTQDMIKQEREIDIFNLYDIIIPDFKNRFCLLVY